MAKPNFKRIELTGKDKLRVVKHVFEATQVKEKLFDASYQEIMEATAVSRTTASITINYLIKNKFLKKVNDYQYKVLEYEALKHFAKEREMLGWRKRIEKEQKFRKKGMLEDDFIVDEEPLVYYNKKGMPKL